MATYALSLYGEDFYGADVLVSYSVGEVSATQTGYGEITLAWTTPMNVQNWKELRVVRNTSGYPVSEDDGDIVLQFDPDSPQNSFTDSGLTGGRFYYYAIFLSSDFSPYSSSSTYQAGDTVAYNGSQWLCIVNNTVGIAPSVSAPQWQVTNATVEWHRAGQASSLAVHDYGYRDLVYSLIPTAYATGQIEVSAPQDPANDVFFRYLSVLAWGLSITRTELGEQEHLHRVSTMPLSRLELMAQQLGVSDEASVTPRLRRYRIENAAELGQRRGTIEAIKEAVYGLTGYDSEITPSRNMLLDADQAESYYPRYSDWDPSVNYQPGAVVEYGGYLYTAKTSVVHTEAEVLPVTLQGAPAYTVQPNQANVSYSNGQQVLVRSNATGQSMTLTFSVPTTGEYDLSVGMTQSFDYGIIRFAVDGTTVTASSGYRWPSGSNNLAFDGYNAAVRPATSVYLGKFSLASGQHTVRFTVVSKNAKSGTRTGSNNGGYQMGVDYLRYVPVGSTTGVGVAPTGTATNNAFWTHHTGVLTNALDNPLTGGISTWEQTSYTAGATANNDSLDVYSGYRALAGTGDNTANLAVMSNSTGTTATLAVHSIPAARTSAWSATRTYVKDEYVSYNGARYLAVLPSQDKQPDVERAYWRPEVIATSGVDRYLVSAYGIPLPQYSRWHMATQYEPGAEVEYQGQLYQATLPSRGFPPTGAPTDNQIWSWYGTAQHMYTASAWTKRHSGTGSPSRSLFIEWYDQEGQLITTVEPSTSTHSALHLDFTRNSPDLRNDPGATSDLNGRSWLQTSTDTPVASSGMVYWATRNNQQNQLGRHLSFAYELTTGISIGITFKTEPPAGIEHGLVFRRADSSNCWTASRTRLAKMVGGTLTTLASWPALPDGTRIYVTLAGSTISVHQYQKAGFAPVRLASVTDTAHQTQAEIGLFERNY